MRITGRPAGLIEGDLAHRTEELVAEEGVGSAPDTSVDAFVSYSRRDAGLVLPVVQAAERRGRSFRFDADDIPGGAAWREELAAAIETADAVVCFLSPAWSTSAECRRAAVLQWRRADSEAEAARRQTAVAEAQLAASRSVDAKSVWSALACAVEAELRTPQPLPEARGAMASALQRLARQP